MANQEVRTVKIVVDAPGVKAALDNISKSMGGISKNTKQLADGFSFLTSTLKSYLGFLGVRELVEFSDSMQNLQNRIATLSGSQEQASKTMKDLLNLANETNTSIDSTAESYARLSTALGNAGFSQKTMLEVVKTLTNSFRLSGSTITEATNATIQLSQAFASGQLRGQELRSVMEQNAVIALKLRERFGKDIYKKAEQGLISVTEVFKVLFNNMNDINTKAQQLTPTIGQTLTKALNNLKDALNDLNKQFDVSGNFAKGVDTMTQKIGLFGVAIALVSSTQIPALIAALEKLWYIMGAVAVNNPLGLALVGLSAAILLCFDSFKDFSNFLSQVQASVQRIIASILEAGAAILKFVSIIPKFKLLGYVGEGLQMQANFFNNFSDSIEEDINTIPKALRKSEETTSQILARQQKELAAYSAANDGVSGKQEKIKDVLGKLNKEFLSGVVSVKEYNAELTNFQYYKLNREFKEGKINLDQLQEGIQKVKREELTTWLNEGKMSFYQFNQAMEMNNLEDLNNKLESGKISIIDYNNELVKISTTLQPGGALYAGTAAYIQSIGTVSQQVAGAITNVFKNLEDSLVDFIKTGQFNFHKFAEAILDDLTRIILRATIISPLANGILNWSSPGPGSGVQATNNNYSNVAARGAYFDGKVSKFASGGVVNSPTSFAYGGGSQMGLMGEAGPEAILPLSRGSGGKLGVQASITPVTVNIINQSDSQVTESEKTGINGERMIEVLIQNKVRDGLSNGSYDKVLNNSYGLRRKGS